MPAATSACRSCAATESQRWRLRTLQRCAVTTHQRDAHRLSGQGDIDELVPSLFL